MDFSSAPKLLLVVAVLVFATFGLLRLNPRLSWRSLYLDRSALSPRRIALGAAIGAAAIGIPILALLALGELARTSAPGGSWWRVAGVEAVFFVIAAAVEELTSRGLLFGVIRQRWGWKTAIATTSLIFGGAHLFNPGATPESILAVTLAGVFLGALLLAIRSLYAVIAAHAAWNWMMSAVFHLSVSGQSIPTPDYAVVDRGPAWLTGGSWGPEGGAAAIAVMLIATFFIYAKFLRRMES